MLTVPVYALVSVAYAAIAVLAFTLGLAHIYDLRRKWFEDYAARLRELNKTLVDNCKEWQAPQEDLDGRISDWLWDKVPNRCAKCHAEYTRAGLVGPGMVQFIIDDQFHGYRDGSFTCHERKERLKVLCRTCGHATLIPLVGEDGKGGGACS